MYVDGRDLMLFINEGNNYKAVASSSACSLSIQAEAVEVLAKDDWQWREYVGGKISWQASANGLMVLDTYNLIDLLNKEVEVVLANVVRDDNNTASIADDKAYYRRGRAIVTAITEDAQVDNKASWTISLQGVGQFKTL